MRDCTADEISKYKTHRNALNHLKRHAKRNYYITKCNEYKNKTHKLWQIINQKISKQKSSGSIINCIKIDNILDSNPDSIANTFGSFYANLGSNLAKNIVPGNKLIDNYINAIPRSLNSMVLKLTNRREIEKFIQDLPNKTSSGFDGISNRLLKQL